MAIMVTLHKSQRPRACYSLSLCLCTYGIHKRSKLLNRQMFIQFSAWNNNTLL